MYDEVYKDRSIVVLKKKRAKVAKKEETETVAPPETLMYAANTDIREKVINAPVVESDLSTDRIPDPELSKPPPESVWNEIAPSHSEEVYTSVWSFPIPDETVEVDYVKPIQEEIPVPPPAPAGEIPSPTVSKTRKGISITTILMWLFGGYFVYDNFDRAKEFAATQGIQFKVEQQIAPLTEQGEQSNEQGSYSEDDLVKVKNIKKFYLQAERGDGQIELRTGGNITWRYNNPGRIKYGDYAKQMGAIGSNGEVSVFPNYEMGKKAVYELLFNPGSDYAKRTVGASFISGKMDYILKKSGLKKDDVLKDLNDEQKDALFKAVETAEGFTTGKVTIFPTEAEFKKNGW